MVMQKLAKAKQSAASAKELWLLRREHYLVLIGLAVLNGINEGGTTDEVHAAVKAYQKHMAAEPKA